MTPLFNKSQFHKEFAEASRVLADSPFAWQFAATAAFVNKKKRVFALSGGKKSDRINTFMQLASALKHIGKLDKISTNMSLHGNVESGDLQFRTFRMDKLFNKAIILHLDGYADMPKDKNFGDIFIEEMKHGVLYNSQFSQIGKAVLFLSGTERDIQTAMKRHPWLDGKAIEFDVTTGQKPKTRQMRPVLIEGKKTKLTLIAPFRRK